MDAGSRTYLYNFDNMAVALLQYQPLPLDPDANRAKIAKFLRDPSLRPGDLVILPETATLPFHPELASAESGDTPLAAAIESMFLEDELLFRKMARERGIYLLAGLCDARETYGQWRNLAVLFDPEGKALFEYQKIHLFHVAGEAQAFVAGDKPPVAVPAAGHKLMAGICFDLRFPETYRAQPQKDFTALVNIANWPASRAEHFDVLARARAIENQSWLFAVNITGRVRNTDYAGGSMIVSPKGEVILNTGREEGLFTAAADPDLARAWREKFPVDLERRPASFWSTGQSPN